jgi:hypothetical protein
MNKKDWAESILFAGFRLLAVACLLAGLLGIVMTLIDTWYRFDPNYLWTFIAATLLKPLLVALAGGLLYLFSGRMAHRMAVRFERSSK